MARRSALYQSVSRVRTDSGRIQRRRRAAGRSGSVAENIARSSDGVDQPQVPGPVDLAAEIADVDVHHVRLRVEVEPPHVLGQLRPALDAPDAAHEELEQRELPDRELHLPGAARYLARRGIEGEIAHLEERH